MINLGENIILSGFKILDPGSMTIIKKMVGNSVKKIQELHTEFQDITFTLKTVHGTEGSEKYEVHAKLNMGKVFAAENTDRNVFMALDSVLKSVEVQAAK